jgi:hypothetical protein
MSQYHRDVLAEMYKDVTDEERIAENKAKADRKRRIEDKRSDTGL